MNTLLTQAIKAELIEKDRNSRKKENPDPAQEFRK
jgi:hypothetical protein